MSRNREWVRRIAGELVDRYWIGSREYDLGEWVLRNIDKLPPEEPTELPKMEKLALWLSDINYIAQAIAYGGVHYSITCGYIRRVLLGKEPK